MLKKYGIDIENLRKKMKNKEIELSPKTAEKLRIISEKYSPLVWFVSFGDFKKNIENGEYDVAYSSDVFKEILKLCEKDYIRTLKKGALLFRARIVDDLNDLYEGKKGIHIEDGYICGYDWINSKEPPIGVSSEGRANIKHSSYFYCSENGNTAASEVKPSINEYVSLATFKTKRNLKLIELSNKNCKDISKEEASCMRELVRYFSVPIRNADDYKFTQFISDEIRKCGIDGIRYKSYFTDSYNYVIFNCSMNTLEFVRSRIIKLHSQKLNFMDISSEKLISTTCEDKIPDNVIFREKLMLYTIMKYGNKSNKDNLDVTKNS